MKKILLTYITSLLVILTSYSQQTLYSFSNTNNTWSLTNGGSDCSCLPTSVDTIIVSHNWANSSFYPLTHPANLAHGHYLSTTPYKVIVKSGGVLYQTGTLPTGMILEVENNGFWGYNGSLILHGTEPNTISSIVNNGTIIANGSFTNKLKIETVGEFCKSGTWTNDITVDAEFNDITSANMDSEFDYTNYGATCHKSIPLPIELIKFKMTYDNDNMVKYSWITASEKNNDYFELLVSNDIINWEIITTINGIGNSLNKTSYEYNSEKYYKYAKLKQVDYDEKYTFSNIISLDKVNDNITIFNNSIFVENMEQTKNVLYVYDISGKVIKSINIDKMTNYLIDLSDLGTGIFFIKYKYIREKIILKNFYICLN